MDDFASLPPAPISPSFRLGVTSYVYPADVLTNIRKLAPVVDDIEVVFFDSGEYSNFPSPGEIIEWRDIAAAHDLTYTIHFPLDRSLGSPDKGEREAGLTTILGLVELCRPLNPHGYILHLEGIAADADATRVRDWQKDMAPLLRLIAGIVDKPQQVCVENTGYPFDWCEPILAEFPFGVCLDFGHLWQMNYDWKAHVKKWLSRTRIIHLYGSDNTSRHYSLQKMPAPLVREALKSIKDYSDVLTLETFGYEDTSSSLGTLSECVRHNTRANA
ncbi:MAG: cobamide remodeling phosphodiesterase CbiR [bacterium]